MTLTNVPFKKGQRCMIEVHGANYPEGVWEGVVETVEPYAYAGAREDEEWFTVTARFDDPRMKLVPSRGVNEVAAYDGKIATNHATLWHFDTKRLFDGLRAQREETRKNEIYYATRERALLDALKVAGKEAIVEDLRTAVRDAVTTASREVFEPFGARLGAAVARLDEVLRVAHHALDRARGVERPK